MENEPHTSIPTRNQVREILASDRGDSAELESWTTEPFTGPADNYASTINRIRVQASLNGGSFEVLYVAKSSQPNQEEYFQYMSTCEFRTEAGFYTEILPKVNSVLQQSGMDILKVPKCFYTSIGQGKDLIILEDLSSFGYKMNNRKRPLDVSHTSLVLKELARLHAASYVVDRKSKVNLVDQYPLILVEDECFKSFFGLMSSLYAENSRRVLQELDVLHRAQEWLKFKSKSHLESLICDSPKTSASFDVVCHGDCWNNNILFRYDTNSQPIDVRLLDFQGCYTDSLAKDIVELMYTSLDGPTRRDHRDSFLATYHESFQRVLKDSGCQMPFSLEELQEEYRRKMEMGLIAGFITIPWVLSDEGLQFYEGSSEDEERLEAFREDLKVKTMKLFEFQPSFKERFLSIFEDMIEAGVFN